MPGIRTVAQSELYAEHRDGRRRKVVFRIDAPIATGGDHKCRVHLKGIERSRYVYGIDSLQSLALALSFLHSRVKSLRESGWRFFMDAKDKEPIDQRFVWFAKVPAKYRATRRNTLRRRKTRAP